MYCTNSPKNKTSMFRIVLKEIISLKNQQTVYLVQDDKGVFVPEEKDLHSIQ